jgi:hypothetical protein
MLAARQRMLRLSPKSRSREQGIRGASNLPEEKLAQLPIAIAMINGWKRSVFGSGHQRHIQRTKTRDVLGNNGGADLPCGDGSLHAGAGATSRWTRTTQFPHPEDMKFPHSVRTTHTDVVNSALIKSTEAGCSRLTRKRGALSAIHQTGLSGRKNEDRCDWRHRPYRFEVNRSPAQRWP